MNEIITSLCVGMLSSSIISLLVSLFGTFKAYREHIKAKKELTIVKGDQKIKIEGILNTQKEIIKILESMENSDKDLAIEILEKTKRELEENDNKHQQINRENVE